MASLQCACGAIATGPTAGDHRFKRTDGWRVGRDGTTMCPGCAAVHYRQKGSALRAPTGPPVDVIAAAPWRAGAAKRRQAP
jgi:hypothetical protein